MNRGGTAVDTKTPLKDGGNAGELGRATKSGRKVKRPAHFDDSPDAKRSASVVARDDDSPKRKEVQEVAKKSARKTLLKNQSEDVSPQRNGAPALEVGKKSARKTLNKQETREEEPEPTQRSSRKTMTVVAKEDTPEPEDIKKSARKTLPKSAVKKPSEPAPETPKRVKQEMESPKKSAKKVDVEEEMPAGPGISRTGRKIKIPAHLKEFEDVVVPSPKKELAEKPTLGRKSLAPAAAQKEEVAPKTPGRGRSLAAPRKAPEPETKVEPKTPRSVKSSASLEIVEQNDPLALPSSTREAKSPRKDKQAAKSPVKALKSPVVDPLKEDEDVPVKTSRRGKSLAAPEAPKSPPAKAENPPTKTPSKRGKSMAASVPVSPPEKAPKTPKQAASKSVVEDLASAEPMSRSGRKIKPKKYFGEFEEEEPVAVVAAPAVKAPSPVKPVAKSSPVAKKEPVPARTVSPVKAVAKSSPVAVKVSSPITRKESPKVASPVKRHLQPVAAEKTTELPKKRAKLAEPKPSSEAGQPEKKLDEISPNTEERQITKRGVNDHHHMAKEDEPEESTQPSSFNEKKELPTKDDKETAEEQKPKRGRKPLAAKSEETPVVVEESKPAEEEQQQPEKPKRGRKTLPAPSAPESSDDGGEEPVAPPKAPKTPVARRMTTTAALVAPATTEDVGSSRSGRKIKPKKFFGEDEPASATKAKPAAPVNGAGTATGGGRGRRKTLAAELDKADKVEEVTPAAPQAELKECPSREEILAVVGVADTVGQTEKLPEPEKMDVAEEPSDTVKAVEEEQEVKKDDEPTPMEEDLPQELEPAAVPEPITTPIVGTVPEEAVAEDVPQEVDESEANAEAPAANGDCPTAVEPLPEHQMESVEPEDDVHDGDKAEGAAVVPEEDEESTLQGTETVESTQEDFQEHSIPQTSPRDQAMIPEEVPESPAPSHEEPPAVMEEFHPVAEPEEVDAVPEVTEVIEETEQEETDQEVPVETVEESSTVEEQAAPVPLMESNQQNAEVSASSSFSEALCVEEESAEQVAAAEPAKLDESKEQQYESVEFLEMSGASAGATEQAVVQPLPAEHTNGLEEPSKTRITTPELEDELDNTEAPPMDDLDDEREDELLEDVQEPQEATFSERDRDNESIIVIPDTPKPPKSQEFDEEFDLMDKSPVPQSSYATVGRVELHHSPVMKQEAPTTPRTPDSKPAKSSCSPDKPDDQEQADVPEAEVIDITDSPITVLEPKLHNLTDGQPGSTTSTPLRMGSKMTAKDRLIQNSRKRSLSASDAEIVKKNVTFHSPANSTMLVDTIDERLKKKNESATKIPHGHRKRSHSEHKDVAGAAATQDGPKPSKISKLPNFKNIHQQQFNRMESIEEFHNRKVQRAKEILATSTVKSPAATALVRSAERPPLQKSSSLPAKSPHKTGNGASSSSSSYKPAVVRPLIPKPTATESSHHKPLSDADRQEKRQKQFHATFKPKSQDGVTPGKDTPDGAHRVVEQSRHKQNQILKGVRTNKRFELMMKYRDAHE